MSYILNLDKDKKLTLRRGVTYIGENNADTITIFLPHTYKDYDLSECSVLLHIIVQNLEGETLGGNIMKLSLKESEYGDMYESEFNISKTYTTDAQTILLKMEIVHADNMVAYSNEVKFNVYEHHTATDVFFKDNPDVLVEYIAKTEEMRAEIDNIYNVLNNPTVLINNGDFRLKFEKEE